MNTITAALIIIGTVAFYYELRYSIERSKKKKKADKYHAKKILDFMNQHRYVENERDLWYYRNSLKHYDKNGIVLKSLNHFSKEIRMVGPNNWNKMTKLLRKKAGI
jgi:hypothetical protein